MIIEPHKKNMMPVILIGLSGLFGSLVAIITARQLDLILAIGLLVGAFSMWLHIRKRPE
jgi:hypothetical protein